MTPSARSDRLPAYQAILEGTVSGPSKLLGNTGAALIGNTGAALIGNTGAALAGKGAGGSAGTVGEAYRVLAYQSVRAAGSIVFLTTPEEEFYRDASGKVVSTTTDSEGRYAIPAALDRPLIVTAMLPHNRRLVGYTYLTAEGSASLDVSLESTYVTEFLRYQARKQGKTMAGYDLASIAKITALTREMIEAGALRDDPDISIAAIPRLVQDYLVAFGSGNKALSDAWSELLGHRPLAVSTIRESAEEGFTTIALAGGPGIPLHFSSMNSTGVAIRAEGASDPIFRGSAARGFFQIHAMAGGPDGRVYFVEQEDRRGGGALAAEDRTRIRLFSVAGDPESLAEERLPVVAELRSYVRDATGSAVIEPSAMAWRGDRLFLGDFRTGLIYEYWKDPNGTWQGSLFAGRIENGLPAPGFEGGDRKSARFGAITHLIWHRDELYVSDASNAVVRRIGPSGQVELVAGIPGQHGRATEGMSLAEAPLSFPKRVAFDRAGRMLIADGDNGRILLVEGGRIRILAGGGATRVSDGDASTIYLGQIDDMIFDADGNLVFTDQASGKARRLWLRFGL